MHTLRKPHCRRALAPGLRLRLLHQFKLDVLGNFAYRWTPLVFVQILKRAPSTFVLPFSFSSIAFFPLEHTVFTMRLFSSTTPSSISRNFSHARSSDHTKPPIIYINLHISTIRPFVARGNAQRVRIHALSLSTGCANFIHCRTDPIPSASVRETPHNFVQYLFFTTRHLYFSSNQPRSKIYA